MEDRAIGVLDSGVGGLTVVKEIFRQLPNEKIIYFGDTARCPYGNRPVEEVKQFTKEIVDFLLEYEVKMIVIACNTATAAALEDIKKSVALPVIGVIQPGSLAAIKKTKTGKIGVIGTVGTIASGSYEKTLKNINPNLTVTSKACPSLVPLVEDGLQSEEVIRKTVKEEIKPLLNIEMDSLILGCTHYPIISDFIQEEVGKGINILSSAEETAFEISALLHYHNIRAVSPNEPLHQFFTTSDVEHFKKIGENWLKKEITVEHIDLKKL